MGWEGVWREPRDTWACLHRPHVLCPTASATAAACVHPPPLLASPGGGASQHAQRVAVLSHWLSAVAAGPGPAAAAVARGKAAAARNSAIQPDPTDPAEAGKEVSVDDSVLETDFEVGPGGVEARMAALQAAGRELEAESLKVGGAGVLWACREAGSGGVGKGRTYARGYGAKGECAVRASMLPVGHRPSAVRMWTTVQAQHVQCLVRASASRSRFLVACVVI